ncbi:hypothetical protein D9619_010820 [Psilocybe cf. subviscida]|uniref:Methyltransferase domain-containing protein n=1 Tax=Psilocybe cf. subviscida TaxID=2480587 RepID=A0A8H5B891_9AGAR|nr:hypothetical protein D9619_010820 [Psilocybe cf. subviscida]
MASEDTVATSSDEAQVRQQGYDSYLLPTDNIEARRFLEQQRALSEIYEGRIVIAPVHLTLESEVLDVATGSGVWALDFAERHPNAASTKIICIDIGAKMFPLTHPPNVTFQTVSALSMPADWTNKFMLVHQRLILTGIKKDEWEQDIREIYRVAASGGWAQICEYNSGYEVTGVTTGPATKRSEELYTRLGEKTGIDFFCARRIPDLMKAAGFVDVDVEERVVPLGAWNGDISRRFAETMITTFRGLKAVVLKYDGLGVVHSPEEYDEMVDEIEREWAAGPGAHVVWDVFVGRKV